jgi:glycosyltransferase involved in cell wall biosynthesis
MDIPLVSVITPTYNAAEYIECCIQSVLDQDYPKIEHILQDGSSGDGTLKILKRYIDKVDWLSVPDTGQADALDRAIRRSHGEILIVLNADDMLLPHAVSWGVRQMAKYPEAAVVYGDILLINEWGEEFGKFLAPEYDFAGVFCVEKVIGTQAAFIRRSMFEQVGLGADPSLDTCPDYEIFVRLGLKFPMRHVSEFVTRYRFYPRPMDGSRVRSVDRFVRAKGSVMEKVFNDPSTPRDIRRLQRRAKAGLYLWASQEARGMSDIREAWGYFAEALKEFSIFGRLASAAILAYLKWRNARPSKIRVSYAPNFHRAMFVGAGLAQDTRGFSIGFTLVRWVQNSSQRVRSFLNSELTTILQTLTSIGLLILIVYLLYVMIR